MQNSLYLAGAALFLGLVAQHAPALARESRPREAGLCFDHGLGFSPGAHLDSLVCAVDQAPHWVEASDSKKADLDAMTAILATSGQKTMLIEMARAMEARSEPQR